MFRRHLLSSAVGLLTTAFAAQSSAQTSARFAIAAASRDTVAVGENGTVTAVFAIRNRTPDSATAQLGLRLPNGWTLLFGPASVRMAGSASDTWIAGITVPPTTAAGLYVVRASIRDSTADVSDSIVVHLEKRRAVTVVTSNVPNFVGARDHYQATFFLRNHGNVPAQLGLTIRSGAGSNCVLSGRSIELPPGGRTTVVANITAPNVVRSIDDVIELVASDPENRISESATARVLVVPRNASGTSNTPALPAELSIRAADRDAGVSPVVLRGYGPIRPGSATNIDFSFHAPVERQSIFGERDEYRLDLLNPKYRVRLGDESRAFSQLTSSGFPGFGAGFETRNRPINGGVYLQQNRWAANGAFEVGTFIGTDTSARFSGWTSVTARNTGARVATLTARTHIASSSTIEAEVGGSDSLQSRGTAQRLQFAGKYSLMSIDLGAMHVGQTFSGPGRGLEQTHGSITTRPIGPLWFQLNTASVHTTPPPGSLFGFDQTFTTNEFTANFQDAISLGYQVATKHQSADDDFMATSQQGPRVSAHYRLASVDLRGTAAYQQVQYGNGSTDPYASYRIEASTELHSNQWIGAYGGSSTGSAFDGLAGGGYVAGGWTRLNLPLGVALDFNGSMYLPAYGSAARNRSGDVTMSRVLRNGATIAFRQHFTRYDRGIAVPGMNAMYLEVRTPLRIPTSVAGASGRVVGQVTDAATGRGLSNLLVRIGGQSVITDSRGRVSLAGLEPGHYGVSLEGSDRASGNLLVGDLVVDVPSGQTRPAKFSVALARSGRVRAQVRMMAPGAGTVGTSPDSLIDAGALDNALVALEGKRDTIYQTTDIGGRLDFGHVAPGTWTVRVVSAEVPEHHKLDVDHLQVTVRSGEVSDVEFRVVPKQRALQMINPDGTEQTIRAGPGRRQGTGAKDRDAKPRAQRDQDTKPKTRQDDVP